MSKHNENGPFVLCHKMKTTGTGERIQESQKIESGYQIMEFRLTTIAIDGKILLLLIVVGRCGSLLVIVGSCGSFCGSLCRSLQAVVGCCGSLWIILDCCGSLQVIVGQVYNADPADFADSADFSPRPSMSAFCALALVSAQNGEFSEIHKQINIQTSTNFDMIVINTL